MTEPSFAVHLALMQLANSAEMFDQEYASVQTKLTNLYEKYRGTISSVAHALAKQGEIAKSLEQERKQLERDRCVIIRAVAHF